jgi:type I restriction enzyme M protein
MKVREVANFIWTVADLLRDHYKRSKYADVILPFTVLRRLDCVLEPTKDEVFEKYKQYGDKLDDPSGLLKKHRDIVFIIPAITTLKNF